MSDNIQDWLKDFNNLNPETASDDTEVVGKKHTLDLFGTVLPAIDKRDKFFYSRLTPEQQDSIEPWILMRWATSVPDSAQMSVVPAVNDLVNDNFSCFTPKKTINYKGHPELQWMLLALCGTGKSMQRKFIKPGGKAVKNRLEEALTALNPLMKKDELELLQKINTQAELEEYFKENAFDDKTIKEIFKTGSKGK